MQPVKIKNINKSYMKKPFVVKGRVRFCDVLPNRNSSGSHLNAIIFDNIAEIEIVAFKSCEEIAKKLPKDSVVMIENGILREVNKDYKKTKHKYQIILQEIISIVTPINNDEVNISDFPLHKYTSGADLKTLTTGMIIDVIGVCTQIDSEKTVNGQQQTIRRANISVDSIPIEVKFSGDKVDELYTVDSTLFLHSVKYINYNGFIHLSVGDSSSVQILINTQQLSNGMDTKQLLQLETVKKFCQDSTIELLIDQKPLTSSITQSNNNSTIELPEQIPSTSGVNQSYRISDLVDESIDERPSTSGSTPSNKRKTHDFTFKEVSSKIQKKTELDETFSDERFVNMVLNLMQAVNNNKHVVQLLILEFISNMLKEDEN